LAGYGAWFFGLTPLTLLSPLHPVPGEGSAGGGSVGTELEPLKGKGAAGVGGRGAPACRAVAQNWEAIERGSSP